MPTKPKLTYILVILLVLGLPFLLVRIQFLSTGDLLWLVILFSALVGAFGLELRKSMSGQKISWDLYSSKDKMLFCYSLVVLLLFMSLPIKFQMPVSIFLCSLLVGYFLGWVPILIFGSENLKKNWLWQQRINRQV
jgi:hypothetical protein